MSDFTVTWDLETVPDLEAFSDAHSLHGLSPTELRDQLGEGFPKLPLHKIICIGALISERVAEGWQARSVGAPHIGTRSEADLIQAFVRRLDELSPRLISYNGHSFDLPVLRYRAMKTHVSAPSLSRRPYFNRYTDDALDLCDALSSFDGRGKVPLDTLAKIMGLPGKPEDIKGGQVESYYNEGRLDEIADYCVSDVINTYRIWLRFELFRGALTREQFEFSEGSISTLRDGKHN